MQSHSGHPTELPVQPEILASVRRSARRFIVVYFPEGWGGDDFEESYDLIPDEPYWWRVDGKFIDRTLEGGA